MPEAGAGRAFAWRAGTVAALQMAAAASALLGAMLLAAAGPAAAGTQGLADGAQVHPPLQGLTPRHSDVIFSTRFERAEAAAVAKAFGATRIEWVYSTKRDYVDTLRATAPVLGGALSPQFARWPEDSYARDFDGALIVAPLARTWSGPPQAWVSTNSEAARKGFDELVARSMQAGMDSLQQDGPQMQYYAAAYFGGDFSVASQAGFAAWLKAQAKPQDVAQAGLSGFEGSYRDWLVQQHAVKDNKDYMQRARRLPSTALWHAYLRSTVVAHFQRLRDMAARERGRPVSLSMNLSVLYEPLASNAYFFLAPVADYTMPEQHIDQLPRMVSQAATARALGMGFAPSLRPRGLAENRVAIAMLYALGGQPLVPWDVFAGNDDKGQAVRFFGKPDEYGDLYGFVRAHPGWFDGLETAAKVGILVPVERGSADALAKLVARLVGRGIPFAFVPVGRNGPADYQADPARLRALDLVLVTNPAADYPPAALAALAASGVRSMVVATLRDDMLDQMRPFIAAPGAEQMRIVPRAVPGDPDRLVLHVVDASRGDAREADPACRRRIGIRRADLGGRQVSGVEWRSVTAGTQVRDTTLSGDVFVTIQGCPLWGLLELKLSP